MGFYKSDSDGKILNQYFSKAESKKIKMIRIALHFHELDKISMSLKFLKSLGYDIKVKSMQITQFNES